MRVAVLLLCLVLFRARALRHTFDYAHTRLVATGPAPDFNGTLGRKFYEEYQRRDITCTIDNDKWVHCNNVTTRGVWQHAKQDFHLNYTIVNVTCDLFYGSPVRETCMLYFNISIHAQEIKEDPVVLVFYSVLFLAGVFYILYGICRMWWIIVAKPLYLKFARA